MPFKFREIERKLIKIGYQIVRQKGSHAIFSDGKNTFPVPKHGSKDVSPGVERKILKALGLTAEQFRQIK
jgi:predicted RNA binding protein YcfA (HicA-like mRNA interferase family)